MCGGRGEGVCVRVCFAANCHIVFRNILQELVTVSLYLTIQSLYIISGSHGNRKPRPPPIQDWKDVRVTGLLRKTAPPQFTVLRLTHQSWDRIVRCLLHGTNGILYIYMCTCTYIKPWTKIVCGFLLALVSPHWKVHCTTKLKSTSQ